MKLSTLRSRKGKSADQNENISDTRNKLKALLKKIHHLMTMLQKKEQEIQDSESLLQEMWEQLMYIRDEQGFCCTEAE
eukprot:14270848-Ditylum_brightwellii.AAC.1